MKTLLALSLIAAVAAADQNVSFELPDAGGKKHTLQDFDSRYMLLVYQGIP